LRINRGVVENDEDNYAFLIPLYVIANLMVNPLNQHVDSILP